MKRNLLAIFLAVTALCALVFLVAPSAKAEDSNTVNQVTLTGNSTLTISENTILNLAGFDATVNVANGVTLSVIDTSFMLTDENNNKYVDFSGDLAGKLTVTSGNADVIPSVYADKFYHYLKVENNDGTYSFHPFNMDFTAKGINTLAGEKDDSIAICLRATFIGNNIVKDKLTKYGVYNKTLGLYIPVQEKYPLTKNGVHAFCDLPVPALDAESIDTTNTFCVYMQFGEGDDAVFDYSADFDVSPREVLKELNKSDATPTIAQRGRIEDFVANNTRVGYLLANLRSTKVETVNELSFADAANRTYCDTNKQIWEQNGIILTNDKGSSTSNVAENHEPARFYKNSDITIEYPGMTKIVFNCNTAAYATDLQSSIGKDTATLDGKVVTVELSEAADSFTFTLSGGQVRMDSIEVIVATGTSYTCGHLKNASDATCSTQAKCYDCDAFYGDTLPHNTTSEANCTNKAVCSMCGEYGEVDADNHNIITAATCTTPAQCSRCGDVGTVDLTNGHNYEGHICANGCGIDTDCVDENPKDNVCDICNNTLSGTTVTAWKLVTNGNSLKIDDQIVIVAKNSAFAMSTTQNSNNRGQIAITKNSDTIIINDSVQILTLKAGTVDGTFALYTGSGYLYAASSSSNYLKTQSTNNANGSWKITIASDGTAAIVAQGNYTRNVLKKNSSSALFSCYASGQDDVVIYKKTEVSACDSHTGGEADCTTPGYCTNCGAEYIDPLGHADADKNHACDRCTTAMGEHVNNGSGTCDYCGGEFASDLTEKTVTMDIIGTKGSLSNKVITWTSNGVTFQNAQASSTTAIRTSDSDHYRIYTKSTVTISGSNIKKVAITCTSSSYATAMQTSLKNAGYTATVSGSVVTVELNSVSEINFTASAQIRINKVEVTYLG